MCSLFNVSGKSSPDDYMQETCERFNKNSWHDSKVLDIAVLSGKNRTHDVCITMRLIQDMKQSNDEYKKARLILKDCRFIRMDLDLEGKSEVSHDLSHAMCKTDSILKKEVEGRIESEPMKTKLEKKPLKNFLHFSLVLIPPGGEINIFARDFELTIENEPGVS